ncbi:activator of Hsp90 ATPase-like protein [Actinophytocola oryzae]|uniref:Activator of Hsp90 ATPase-like protein n=1 Tax=Actinophytocola oryzae TaxID=502181 RepID=A0A4R7UZ09_9PSEU|nr:activator of Hsp90 ATPase-like protein [Actinophytocola oryzae]
MLSCDPPVLLEYTWDTEVLRWELSDAEGGTRLVFTNIVDDESTAAAVDPGWDVGLKRLADALDL